MYIIGIMVKSNSLKKSSNKSIGSKKSSNLTESFNSINSKLDVEEKEKQPLIVNIISVILSVIVITINILAIQWIYRLEEISCKCSEDWKRDYIKYFLIVYFFIIIIQIFSYILFGELIHKYSKVFVGVLLIFGLFSYVNIAIAIIYINDLKNIKCECSEDTRREIYYYYNIIAAIIIAMGILYFLIALAFMFRKLKN